MLNKVLYRVMTVMAILVGFYPIIYFIVDRKFGLLSTKTPELLHNLSWNINFYIHIIFGGVALLIGWTQFNTTFRSNNLLLHKRLGKLYVISVLLSSLAGIYIGYFATGGIITSLGFMSLGVVWFYITLKAFITIKNKNIIKHRKLMIYSYSLCFAAVTLRIWMPILIGISGDFNTGYTIAAWLCWIPNLIVAYRIIKKQKTILQSTF